MGDQLSVNQTFVRNFKIDGLDGSVVTCDIFNHDMGEDRRPAFVFVHGGGFVGGDKDQFFGAASWISLTTGALCITLQYRTVPANVYPAPVIDCLSAFTWLWNQRELLQIRPEWVCVAGGSPGANIGAMAMMAEEGLLAKYGLNPKGIFQPRNGIFLNGIYDLADFYERNPEERGRIKAYLDASRFDRRLWREASPVCHRKADLNLLLLHGSEDVLVPLKQCEEMKDVAERERGRARIRIFEGKPHAWFNEPQNLYEVLVEIKKYVEEIKRGNLNGTESSKGIISGCDEE